MNTKISKIKNLSKVITLKELGEFTEEVILPGVERIVENRVDPIEQKVDTLTSKVDTLTETVKIGFANISRSIQVLAGEEIETKKAVKEIQENKLQYEDRLRVVERKTAIRV